MKIPQRVEPRRLCGVGANRLLLAIAAIIILCANSGCSSMPPASGEEVLSCHLDSAQIPSVWECSAAPSRLLVVK